MQIYIFSSARLSRPEFLTWLAYIQFQNLSNSNRRSQKLRTWPQKSKLCSVLLIPYPHSDVARLLQLVVPEAISKRLRLDFEQRAQLFSTLSYPCLQDLINPDVKARIPERARRNYVWNLPLGGPLSALT